MFRFDGFSSAKVKYFFLFTKFMWLSTPEWYENLCLRDETRHFVANEPTFSPLLGFHPLRSPASGQPKARRRGRIIATFSAKRRLQG
jgi:hypothetical protein